MIGNDFGLMDRFYWNDTLGDLNGSAEGRIAVVGLPGVGKKTLCNSLWGWDVLDDETNGDVVQNYGLFYLIDLPTEPFDIENVMFRLESVDLVIYLLDAEAEVSKADFSWIARLRSSELTLVIALNKSDRLSAEEQKSCRADLEERLARSVIPLSARDKDAVRQRFLPVLLKACPKLAVPLASEVAGLRQKVAHSIIRECAMLSTLASNPEMPGDPGSLSNIQTNMLNRIAALYGYKARNDQLVQLAMTTILSRVQQTYARQMAHTVDADRQMVTTSLGAASTWVIGRLAVAYYQANLPSLTQWFNGKRPYDTPQTGDE